MQTLLIARNPEADSSLPYIVRIPLGDGIVLRVKDTWPRTSKIYCHPHGEGWPELLTVGGRDRTTLVTGIQKQVALVREAMADLPEVPVRGVLCFVDADWPIIGPVFTVNNVAVMSPKKLKTLLSQPGLLDEEQIADAQWRLHESFPRQKSASSAQ